MRLQHTTADQDKILSICEDFGGRAAEAAEIAAELDDKLDKAHERIKELELELDSK